LIKIKEIVKDGKFPIDPFSWQTRFSVCHVGITVEYITVPWDQRPDILELKDLAPVLIDQERIIKGSWNISNYLERNFIDSPSLFGGMAGAGACQFVDSWVDQILLDEIYALIIVDLAEENMMVDSPNKLLWEEKIKNYWGDLQVEEVKKVRNERRSFLQQEILKPLRKTVTTIPFLGGETPAYSDYCVAGALNWARTLSCFDILESSDPIFSWLEEVLNLYSSQFKRPQDTPLV